MCVLPCNQGYNELCAFLIALCLARLLEGSAALLLLLLLLFLSLYKFGANC